MTVKQKSVAWISSLLLLIGCVTAFYLYCPLGQSRVQDTKQFFGYTPKPDETAQFVASLPTPTIRDADPNLFRGDKVDTFLYRPLREAFKETYGRDWEVHYQKIGDCVSHGWGLACDTSLAVDYKIGKVGGFKESATEAIYGGSRVEARGVSFGGWSDGSYGGAAAKWVREWGIVYREEVGGHDLRVYSGDKAKNWGAYGAGGKDDDGKLDAIAKLHPVREVTLVRNFEEAAAAIQNGYAVSICSGQGFASTRDEQGFARASGSWAHCMSALACRFGDRPGLLIVNSWGSTWISGPKWPSDMPDGSFWADSKVIDRMLSGGDSFAVASAEGFKQRNLNHGAWVQVKPQDSEKDETLYALAP